MNSPGSTTPLCGWLHRSTASTPVSAAGGQAEGGLVEEEELAGLDRLIEIHFEPAVIVDSRLHRGNEGLSPLLSRRLGSVHRNIGVTQQVVGRGLGSLGDPDARRDEQWHLTVSDLERGRKRVEDPSRSCLASAMQA